MKLLYCKKCDSMVRLTSHHRQCECGKTGGRYTDNLNATYYGNGVKIGIDNNSFGIRIRGDIKENVMYSLSKKYNLDDGNFDAFVIGCMGGCSKTFVKITKKEYEKI